jgi:hypothetical protein
MFNKCEGGDPMSIEITALNESLGFGGLAGEARLG